MDQLVIGVLAVGTHATPDDRAGGVIHRLAILGHPFAVALHVQLLQMVRQAGQIVIVGQYRVAFGIPEVVVPDAQHGHDHRQVLLQRGGAEMLVQLMGSGQQGAEIVHAHAQGNRQADGGPQRVAPTHPVPHGEQVVFIQAEVRRRRPVGGDGHKVIGNRRLVAAVFQEPVPCDPGIGQGFLGAERLGLDQEQSGFRLYLAQHLADIAAVDVGHKMAAQAVMEGCQGFCDQLRPQVGAADTNADHVGEGLPAEALVPAAVDVRHKGFHPIQGLSYLGQNILAVDDKRSGRISVAQGDVQGGAGFGTVDRIAPEHGFDTLGQRTMASQGHQFVRGIPVDAILRVVQGQAGCFQQEMRETLGIRFEQGPHGRVLQILLMLLKRQPWLTAGDVRALLRHIESLRRFPAVTG